MPDKLSLRLSQIEFNDGTKIDFEEDELVVLVGPNNVGETATLLGILQRLHEEESVIIRKIITVKSGDQRSVQAWIERHFKQDANWGGMYRTRGGRVQFHETANHWKKNAALGDLTEFFCRFVTTEDRLAASRPTDNLDPLTEPCIEPIQALAANRRLETQLSDAAMQAFGIPLFLDRWSGKKIGVRCGEVPREEPWTLEFLRNVRNRPPLELQGDGIRSFVGCMLEGILDQRPVVLIDEPDVIPSLFRAANRRPAGKRRRRAVPIATRQLDLFSAPFSIPLEIKP